MENKIIDFNLPEWVDDLTEPFWTENTIRYYEPHFVKPRKTFDEFIDYLVNNLNLE